MLHTPLSIVFLSFSGCHATDPDPNSRRECSSVPCSSVFTSGWRVSLKLCYVYNRNSLNDIVKTCSEVIGVKQRDLNSFCNQQILWKAESILASPGHVLADECHMLPSGRIYALPALKTNRWQTSLIPSAVKHSILFFCFSFDIF